MGDTGYIGKIARGTLGILCLILLIIGLVLVVVGVTIISNPDAIKPYVKEFEDTFREGLKDAGVEIDLSKFSLDGFIQPVAKYLIISGSVIILLALLGFFGACNKMRKLLIAFCIIFGLMFGINCVAVYKVFNDPEYFASIKVVFFDTIKEYGGIESTDLSSMAWNSLMLTLECCGVDSYTDFSKSTKWPPKTLKDKPVSELQQLKTPLFCCKDIPDLTNQPPDLSCATNPSADHSWKDVGCYTRAWDRVVKHKSFTMIMIVSTSVQGLIVACSLWLLFVDGAVRKENKKKKHTEDVEKAQAEKEKAKKEKAKKDKAKKDKAEKDKAEKDKTKKENTKLKEEQKKTKRKGRSRSRIG